MGGYQKDFTFLLPLLARLPQSLGYRLAWRRGLVNAFFQRDWRREFFTDDELHRRLYTAYRTLRPDLEEDEVHRLVRQRYGFQSVEEWEGALLGRGRPKLNVRYEGIEKVWTMLEAGTVPVFVTAHYGSSILGITFLETFGIPLLVMSSNVVFSEDMPQGLQKYFRKKYHGIEPFLHGGTVMEKEGNTRKFVEFLRGGNSIVILADLPPSPGEKPIWRNFFGQVRGFAPGATRLAERHHRPVVGFLCDFDPDEQCYTLRFEAEEDPYAFFERQFARHPERWWAADLLPLYPTQEGK